MANFTDYLENELLDHTLGVAAYTAPTVYLAAFTADPTDTGTQTNEVANSYAYARVALSGKFSAAASGSSSNTALVSFPAANGGDWGTVTHVGIMDDSAHNGGNMLYHIALTASQSITDGTTFEFQIGDLTMALN